MRSCSPPVPDIIVASWKPAQLREYLDFVSSGQGDIGKSFGNCVHLTKHKALWEIHFFISSVILMPSLEENNGLCFTPKLLVSKTVSKRKGLCYSMKPFSPLILPPVTAWDGGKWQWQQRQQQQLASHKRRLSIWAPLNASSPFWMHLRSHPTFYFFFSLKSSVFKSHYFNYVQLNVLHNQYTLFHALVKRAL